MKALVVYASRYGSTEEYAQAFAAKHSLKAIPFNQLHSFEDYDTIFHFGALLGGGTYGLKDTLKRLDSSGNQRLIIVTVGLSDPHVQENREQIRKNIEAQVPETILNQTAIYHLRGRINYQELSLLHRLMMYMVYSKAKRTPPEEKTEETQGIIDTYNQTVDFVDLDSLDQIKY